MNWYRKAQSNLDEPGLNEKLKALISSSPFFIHLFKTYDVPMDFIGKGLEFKIADLKGQYAKSKEGTIYLDDKILRSGKFFPDGIHFVVHELTHWLTRQRERECYFSDPEEVEAFTLGIAWEILRGKDKQYIHKVYYPIIRGHFDNDQQAMNLFEKFFQHATSMQSKFK